MTDVMDRKEGEGPEKTGVEAFSRRYGDLVYAAALRQVGEGHAADVMQGVFMVMVRKEKEGKLPEERFMAGWLLRVTGHVVSEMKRAGRRRVKHERRAAKARPEEVVVGEEEKGAVLRRLDEVLLAMRAVDREVIARRYLRSESVGEVAAAMGMTENGVSKRIARALEKLRAGLARRGVTLGVAGIAGVMGSQALVKTPAVVAGTLVGGTGAVSGEMVQHVLWRMAMAKAKTVAGVALAGLILGAGTMAYVAEFDGAGPLRSVMGQRAEGAATSGADLGPTTLKWQPLGKKAQGPEPTEMMKRYRWVFFEVDEKRDKDAEIVRRQKALGKNITPDQEQGLVDEQAIDTAVIWKHVEAAVREIAARHGASVAELNSAPAIPENPAEVGVRGIQSAIQARMVIPLSDDMAREVVDAANAAYLKANAPASQP